MKSYNILEYMTYYRCEKSGGVIAIYDEDMTAPVPENTDSFEDSFKVTCEALKNAYDKAAADGKVKLMHSIIESPISQPEDSTRIQYNRNPDFNSGGYLHSLPLIFLGGYTHGEFITNKLKQLNFIADKVKIIYIRDVRYVEKKYIIGIMEQMRIMGRPCRQERLEACMNEDPEKFKELYLHCFDTTEKAKIIARLNSQKHFKTIVV